MHDIDVWRVVWRLFDWQDMCAGGEDDDACLHVTSLLHQNSSTESVQCETLCQLDHHILYSHSYSVPVLYFNVYKSGWYNSLLVRDKSMIQQGVSVSKTKLNVTFRLYNFAFILFRYYSTIALRILIFILSKISFYRVMQLCQCGLGRRNSVRSSVTLLLLWQNQTMHCRYFYPHKRAITPVFLIPAVVDGTCPLPSKICA